MGWNYLSILKLQRCNRWSLGMDKWFHPTQYWACDNLVNPCLCCVSITLSTAVCLTLLPIVCPSLSPPLFVFPLFPVVSPSVFHHCLSFPSLLLSVHHSVHHCLSFPSLLLSVHQSCPHFIAPDTFPSAPCTLMLPSNLPCPAAKLFPVWCLTISLGSLTLSDLGEADGRALGGQGSRKIKSWL